jgi:hypothetical protein
LRESAGLWIPVVHLGNALHLLIIVLGE